MSLYFDGEQCHCNCDGGVDYRLLSFCSPAKVKVPETVPPIVASYICNSELLVECLKLLSNYLQLELGDFNSVVG